MGGLASGFEDLGSLEKIACGAEWFVRSQRRGMRIESAAYGSWNCISVTPCYSENEGVFHTWLAYSVVGVRR